MINSFNQWSLNFLTCFAIFFRNSNHSGMTPNAVRTFEIFFIDKIKVKHQLVSTEEKVVSLHKVTKSRISSSKDLQKKFHEISTKHEKFFNIKYVITKWVSSHTKPSITYKYIEKLWDYKRKHGEAKYIKKFLMKLSHARIYMLLWIQLSKSVARTPSNGQPSYATPSNI